MVSLPQLPTKVLDHHACNLVIKKVLHCISLLFFLPQLLSEYVLCGLTCLFIFSHFESVLGEILYIYHFLWKQGRTSSQKILLLYLKKCPFKKRFHSRESSYKFIFIHFAFISRKGLGGNGSVHSNTSWMLSIELTSETAKTMIS